MNNTLLSAEYRRAKKQWPFIDEIEKAHKLPVRLLYAVGWRETRLQNIMGDFSQRAGESSPRHHGFGVWQRDSGTFGVDESYLKNVRKQAKDAAELLRANFGIVDDWAAAIAAYNCGPGNVRNALAKNLSVDHFTTGGNYSADVMATRLVLAKGSKAAGQPDHPDPSLVPPRGFFKPGRSHENFTPMGKRFLVWLKDDISCEGDEYKPGAGFSTFDRENVKKCQVLMGDEPDGWFGQSQWAKLMTEKPPKQPPNSGACPVAGLRVTQGFAIKDARYAAGEHTGIDFGTAGDDTIRCTGSGVVVVSSLDSDGFGNYVVVQHEGDRFSWYCHLSRRDVAVGDRVTKASTIGMMGSTGNSRGKHLHYQESVGGHSYWDYAKPSLLLV
ncbi:MAG: M23 family metallopeptidase [Nocardioidaceae bacterium]|nr:M23 family metallopeptidase [Nocardioidaceae bacterium]